MFPHHDKNIWLQPLLDELTDRDQIAGKLRLLRDRVEVGPVAVDNLFAEPRLPREAWLGMIEALRRALFAADDVKAAITRFSRDWTLKGPPLSTQPASFCRAVSVARFSRLLVELNYFASVERAVQNVRSTLRKPVQVVISRWDKYDLGRHVMWSTFDLAGQDAFRESDSAEYICGVLGLDIDPDEPGNDLILLVYTLPPGNPARFPTVADAYAGSTWSPYFRPAPVGSPHGWTMPCREFRKEQPRPEAVHRVIQGNRLIKVREVLSSRETP